MTRILVARRTQMWLIMSVERLIKLLARWTLLFVFVTVFRSNGGVVIVRVGQVGGDVCCCSVMSVFLFLSYAK